MSERLIEFPLWMKGRMAGSKIVVPSNILPRHIRVLEATVELIASYAKNQVEPNYKETFVMQAKYDNGCIALAKVGDDQSEEVARMTWDEAMALRDQLSSALADAIRADTADVQRRTDLEKARQAVEPGPLSPGPTP